MHPKFEKADQLSSEVIGAAIEVHRILGPGLLESIYETCLIHELGLRGMVVEKQDEVRIRYKQIEFTEVLKYDVLVNRCLLIEVKAVQEVHPVHKAQLLSYMKLLDVPIGLIINFHELRVVDGLSRMILRGAGEDAAQGPKQKKKT
jgi:GxxExxY protein